MKGVRRFTVSVPGELLEALDEKLVRDDESRSAVVRRLVEEALHELEEQEQIERYVPGVPRAATDRGRVRMVG